MSEARAEFSLFRLGTGIFLIVSAAYLMLAAVTMRGVPPLPLILMAIASLVGSRFCLPKAWRLVPVAGIGICVITVVGVMYHHQRRVEEFQRQEALIRRSFPIELPGLTIEDPGPDIQATTISGREMTLSSQRGRVVLLVFWASWCGPCVAEIPHEKELLARFEGRPFTIVGVNCDRSLERAQAAVVKHEIPWESFWNGEGGGSGPLTEQFGVQAWPTTYVYDDLGIIRHKQLRGHRLDGPLEELIATAERRARIDASRRGE